MLEVFDGLDVVGDCLVESEGVFGFVDVAVCVGFLCSGFGEGFGVVVVVDVGCVGPLVFVGGPWAPVAVEGWGEDADFFWCSVFFDVDECGLELLGDAGAGDCDVVDGVSGDVGVDVWPGVVVGEADSGCY